MYTPEQLAQDSIYFGYLDFEILRDQAYLYLTYNPNATQHGFDAHIGNLYSF